MQQRRRCGIDWPLRPVESVCCAVCGRASISEDAASAAERAENETTKPHRELDPKISVSRPRLLPTLHDAL